MATATVGLTFTNPRFAGPLFHLSPRDTPFLSMIGGANGGRSTNSMLFTWQDDQQGATTQPAIVQGADPSYSEITRSEYWNVTQIFQKGVEISYTLMANTGLLGEYAVTRNWSVLDNQPVGDERARQLMLKMEGIKREIEYSFLRGVYQLPANNTTGRKTRGIRNAISTNVVDLFGTATTATFDFTGGGVEDEWTATAHGLAVGDEIQFTTVGTGADEYAVDTPYWVVNVPDANTFQVSATKGGSVLAGTADSVSTWKYQKAAKFTKSNFDRLVREMVEGTEVAAPLSNPVIICGAYAKQNFSDIYGYAPESRTVGGLNIQQVVTDFGDFGITFDRFVHPGEVYLIDLAVCQPVFNPVPGKGLFFAEQLSQTGAAEHWQIYGEMGLQYGPEQFHGLIKGSTTA